MRLWGQAFQKQCFILYLPLDGVDPTYGGGTALSVWRAMTFGEVLIVFGFTERAAFFFVDKEVVTYDSRLLGFGFHDNRANMMEPC